MDERTEWPGALVEEGALPDATSLAHHSDNGAGLGSASSPLAPPPPASTKGTSTVRVEEGRVSDNRADVPHIPGPDRLI